NPDNHSIAAFDADGLHMLYEIPVGDKPSAVTGDSVGQIWVSCRANDNLWIINAQTGVVIDSVSLGYGADPVSVVAAPDGQTVYVAEYGSGRLIRIHAASRTITGQLDIGTTPFALAIRADGSELLATRFISENNQGSIQQVNLNTWSLSGPVAMPLDASTIDSEVAGRGLPNYVFGLGIHPAINEAWYAAQKVNILRGQHLEGTDLSFEMMVRSLISPIDLATGQEQVHDRIDVDNHGMAGGITYSPFGNHLLVTMPLNNTLMVVDPFRRQATLEIPVGLMPTGLAIDPVSLRAFVKNENGRSLTVLDVAPLIAKGTGGIDSVTTLSTVSSEQMAPDLLLGKQVFYNAADGRMGLDGYISCGSCHFNGGSDGQIWDFTQAGEGLRNTTTLQGGAASQGRLHWTGNFDELQDFEGNMRTLF
ncbi:MAG: hypothetical protein AAFV07_20455, partial [Bacteroidota bacterium]